MNNDIKSLRVEIILMVLILLIIIPICVNASHNYSKKKSSIQQYNNVSIDIKYQDSAMFINVNNYNKNKKVVNLIMRTTKFSNEYVIELDGKEYNLKDIPYTEDDDHYYFNLGVYKVDKVKKIKFAMSILGDDIYDDSITYSFVAEAANC